MQDWLLQEIRDCAKALDLRVKEAADLVAEYAAGRLSPEQAADRLFTYQERWGDALFGATAGMHTTDEQILASIDSARAQQWSSQLGHSNRPHRSR